MPIKEIEVKAKIRNRESLIQLFSKEGIVFGAETSQEDTVFINYSGLYKDYPLGAVFIRVRVTKEKVFLTVKKPQGQGKNTLSKIEKELIVSDAKIASEIPELLGYRKAVVVNKKRRKTNFKNYEICLDEVEGLGDFVEVEKMSDEDDETVYNELFSFLEKFGIKKEDRVFIGYDILMAEKLGM